MKSSAAEYIALRTASDDTASCFIGGGGAKHGRLATAGGTRDPQDVSSGGVRSIFQIGSLKPGTI